MKKIWAHKASSFKQASKFDDLYYLKMSRNDRINTVQLLRELYQKLRGLKNENRKRLRRSIKIIQ
jgi:hypothetical protein